MTTGFRSSGASKSSPATAVMRTVDGSLLEGGGQVIRNATAFAVLLDFTVHINNVRGKRPKPGLQRQHATGVNLLKDLCGGSVTGAIVGSSELQMRPGERQCGDFLADIKSAGSICLLVQSALPCAIFAPGPCNFDLRGGTNADFSPQIDFLVYVLQPMLARMGVEFALDIRRRGFYPKGGGQVIIRTRPLVSPIKPIILDEPGVVALLRGRIFFSRLPRHVATTMHATAAKMLQDAFPGVPLDLEIAEERGCLDACCGLILVAETTTGCLFSGSEVGKRGIPSEAVALVAVDMLLADVRAGGCVDRHLQDQLILFMALAQGHSRIRAGSLELHTETAIHFAHELAGAMFTVTKPTSEQPFFIIECDGISLAPSS